MKQFKKLTRNQKVKLSKKGFDPENFVVKQQDHETFTVIAKEADENGARNEYVFAQP